MIDDKEFENEVRRIARSLWPSAEHSGSLMVEGRERDGVFVTEECTHLLECTTSRAKEKAVGDSKKLVALAERYRKQTPEKAVKCWFVTREEPTADQRTVCHAYRGLVSALSFQQFQSKLINVVDYLQLREKHRFGSAYDPKTESFDSGLNYLDIDLLERGSAKIWDVADIATTLMQGERFLFLGDYGVGKSMTLRELFFQLRKFYFKSKTARFPIYINLREHHGQSDPAEILERHARTIGFETPTHLVRAWKAGYAVLLIDGFDEVSSVGLRSGWKQLQSSRYASMEGVRRMIQDTPASTGVALAGRNTFFDTDKEREAALACSRFHEIQLGEFNEAQIVKFLTMMGYCEKIPSWLPSRPLLLSTLFSKGMRLAEDNASLENLLSGIEASEGWDLLLGELCRREAKIEAGLSGDTIRRILEHLATRARAKPNGLGPLSPREITEAFADVCGYEPADQSLLVLQRLPGMGRETAADDGSRTFIDSDLADACRAGELLEFLSNPYNTTPCRLCEAHTRIGETGLGIAALRYAKENDVSGEVLWPAIEVAKKEAHPDTLLADIVLLASMMKAPLRHTTFVTGVAFDTFQVGPDCADLSGVSFSTCLFNRVEVDPRADPARIPSFTSCMIQEFEGRVSMEDLPSQRFFDTHVDLFLGGTLTNDTIFELHASKGVKVMLSIFKKLFVQSLGGRTESALYRGLDPQHQKLIPEVVSMLRQHNVITKLGRAGEPVWLPVRRQRARIMGIMNAPSNSQDILVTEASKIL